MNRLLTRVRSFRNVSQRCFSVSTHHRHYYYDWERFPRRSDSVVFKTAVDMLDKCEYDNCLEFVEKQYTQHDNKTRNLLLLVAAYIHHGFLRYQEASQILDRAIDPNAEYLYRKALSYALLDDIPRTMQTLEDVIEAEAINAPYAIFLSAVMTIGRALASNAESKNEPLQELYKAYTEAYHDRSIPDEERKQRWDKFSELSSNIATKVINNYRTEVISTIEKVKLRQPYNYRLFWMQAYMLQLQREFKESIAYYTLALNYAQEHEYPMHIAQIMGDRTICQFTMENPTENFGGFRDEIWLKLKFCAYDVYSSDRTRYHHMVEHIDAKKYEEAIEIGMSILEHDPYSSHVNEAIGFAYFNMQDYEKAIQYCECGLLCAAHDPKIRQPMWYVLAESYKRLSNFDEEIKYRKLLVEAAKDLGEQVQERYNPHHGLKKVLRMAHTRLLSEPSSR